jgi:hypothetical protein
MLSLFALVAALEGIAPATMDAVFAPLKRSEARWAALGPAGPFYPVAGQVQPGEAVLECRMKPEGRLSGCRVISETPRGKNFGVAAQVMARRGHIRAPAFTPEGSDVRVRVPFQPGAPVEIAP